MASTLRAPETIPSLSIPTMHARSDGAAASRSVVKEIAVGDERRASALAKTTEGLVEAIVGAIGDPAASPGTKKASLVAAYRLASSSERAAGSFADSGSVALLLELLVDSSAERGACEKALGALDAVLGSEKGREAARGHALAVPVLVKKMFRVSDLATEFAVSGLWRLFKNCGGGGDERRTGLARAALSMGAFEKLLLLLQVGCSEGAKEKASELLRMLNRCRGELGEECVDTSDFRGVKRNF